MKKSLTLVLVTLIALIGFTYIASEINKNTNQKPVHSSTHSVEKSEERKKWERHLEVSKAKISGQLDTVKAVNVALGRAYPFLVEHLKRLRELYKYGNPEFAPASETKITRLSKWLTGIKIESYIILKNMYGGSERTYYDARLRFDVRAGAWRVESFRFIE